MALALTACGDLSRAELKRGVESLGATAAEGELLAHDVERDRTKKTYARVHARTLAEDAQHEAEKLTDAKTAAGLDARRRRAADLAGLLGDALGDLQVGAGDEREGARIRGRLVQLQEAIERLEDEL